MTHTQPGAFTADELRIVRFFEAREMRDGKWCALGAYTSERILRECGFTAPAEIERGERALDALWALSHLWCAEHARRWSRAWPHVCDAGMAHHVEDVIGAFRAFFGYGGKPAICIGACDACMPAGPAPTECG